jgi:endonuclease YncB( thermonuclease family)
MLLCRIPDRSRAARRLFSALLCFLACSAHDATLAGRVVGITNGDTITVLDGERRQHKIRLAGIDAPEKAKNAEDLGQPFAQRSKENLSRLVFDKTETVHWRKKHRGRLIGKVWVQPADCPRCGPTLDAGQAQLAAGMAWWYRKYARDQSAEDRGRYEFEENEARVRRVGLWQDPEPVPPWEWRRRQSSPAN